MPAPESPLVSEVSVAKILLVEDENVINMVTQDRVEGMGHTVCDTANTGQDAVEQAAAKKPDLVIMDITLKGKMDGIETAGRIRQLFDIPVIYLTAYDDKDTRRRAEATDPIAYLVKTFEDVELRSAIERAVQRGRGAAKGFAGPDDRG